MKNRITSVLLALCLVFVLMPGTAYASSPTVTVGSISDELSVGDTFTVDLTVSNNPGFTALGIDVDFDTDVLEITKTADNGDIMPNNTFTPSMNLTSPYRMIWEDGMTDYTHDGKLCTLTFEVISVPANGSTSVSANVLGPSYTYDSDLEGVSFETVSGTIYMVNDGFTVHYEANGGTDAPENQNSPTNISSDTPTKSYKLTYNANGGTVSPAYRNVFAPFIEWNTEADGSGMSYDAGEACDFTENTTLYAQYGAAVAGELPVPERFGNVFEGWFDSARGGSRISADTVITKNTTIYAHWSEAYVSPTDVLTLSAGTAKDKVGKTVELPISITDNPGIIALSFDVTFDTQYINLISVENTGLIGTDLTTSVNYTSPYTMAWNNAVHGQNYSEDGVIAILTFEIIAAPDDTDEVPVSISIEDPDNTYNINYENVGVICSDGKVTIQPRIPGDVNGDGKVNQKDATYLSRYLAHWEDHQNPDLDNADVNGDGKVNQKDVTRLRRYLAGGWPAPDDTLV